MIFSLEDGGIPLLSSVFVPWLLVWENLAWRMKVVTSEQKTDADSGLDPVGLSEIDVAIDRMRADNRTRNAVVDVNCGPGTPYTLQLIMWCGTVSALVRVQEMRFDSRDELAWVLAEASMLTHYCAIRLKAPADRLIVSVGECLVPRGRKLNRRSIGLAAYVRQPRVEFIRVSAAAGACQPTDVRVVGYMRSSRVDSRIDLSSEDLDKCTRDCRAEDNEQRARSFSCGVLSGKKISPMLLAGACGARIVM
uniref:Uncharacterized protein n=1 Tax=Anatid alphaherpesvirus 2 TaxID=3080522 RepID=A0AAU0K7Y3_9ALPH